MILNWPTLQKKTRESLLTDYNAKRKAIAETKNCVSRFFTASFCSDRTEEAQRIIDTLDKIEEMETRGQGISAIEQHFSDELKLSILVGAYITVLDDIVEQYRGSYKPGCDWHNSALAMTIISYLEGETKIDSDRVVAKANYQSFIDKTYPNYTSLLPSLLST